MTENKRYKIKGSDDFFQHIEDTTYTEDKHEGAIYNIYQVVNRLNKQDNKIKKLKTEIQPIRDICKKYQIPIQDLPAVLEEYIATDNEEYQEKIKGGQ